MVERGYDGAVREESGKGPPLALSPKAKIIIMEAGEATAPTNLNFHILLKKKRI